MSIRDTCAGTQSSWWTWRFSWFFGGGSGKRTGDKTYVFEPQTSQFPSVCTSFRISFHLEQEHCALVCCKLLFKNDYVPRQKHWTLFDGQDSLDPEWETSSCPSPSRSAELSFYFLSFSAVFIRPRLISVFCLSSSLFTPWLVQYVTHHLYSFPELFVIPFNSVFIYFMRAETVPFISP